MKKDNVVVQFAAIAAFTALMICGCGDAKDQFPLAEVSGTVTMDGSPMPGVEVTFFPRGTDDNSIVGPFSSGITDANGKFTMKTRYGDTGAVIGNHRVEMALAGVDPEMLDEARAAQEEAASEGDEVDEAAKQAEEEAKNAMKGKRRIPAAWGEESTNEFEVKSGSNTADFDLSK